MGSTHEEGAEPAAPPPALVRAVRLYRELEFFRADAHFSDEALAAALDTRYRARHHRPVDLGEPLFELDLLSLDEARVWWADLEDDVFPGENAYARLFAEWARISRGAFRPEGVTERWGPYGEPPVRITFRLGDREHRLRSDSEEWIDLGLLDRINRLIAPSGYAFVTVRTGDQTGRVVVLTAAEKARLERARWRGRRRPPGPRLVLAATAREPASRRE